MSTRGGSPCKVNPTSCNKAIIPACCATWDAPISHNGIATSKKVRLAAPCQPLFLTNSPAQIKKFILYMG
ncbi:hypothetical protein EHZ86_06550 [Aeromonas australiensis]|nr:hypothetical protein [Aeromonas australiensis]